MSASIRPSRSGRPRITSLSAVVAIWAMLLVTYVVGKTVGSGLTYAATLYAAAAAVSGMVFSAAFIFVDGYIAAPQAPAKRILRIGAAVALVTLLHALWDLPLQVWIEGELPRSPLLMLWLNFIYYFWTHGTAAGLIALLRLTDELHQAEQRASSLVLESARAQVSALRLQINPHFLFNTLNAVSSLILTSRPREAEVMLGRLAGLLRLSLNADPDRFCPLEHELALAECYTDVEQARYGERLQVAYRVEPDALSALVPCFLLQPLLEATVNEVMEHSMAPLRIEVLAQRDGDAVRVEIRHDVMLRATAPSPLEDTRRRLELAYRGEAAWEASAGSEGFRLALSLPQAA